MGTPSTSRNKVRYAMSFLGKKNSLRRPSCLLKNGRVTLQAESPSDKSEMVEVVPKGTSWMKVPSKSPVPNHILNHQFQHFPTDLCCQHLGIHVPLCFTSPNYWEYNPQRNIWFGGVKQIPNYWDINPKPW